MYQTGEPTRTPRWVRSTSRHRASSLVELLVVISVIGILVTMLLPSLKRSMQLASTTICMHNLREVGHSLTLYRVENDGWLPTSRAEITSQLAGSRAAATSSQSDSLDVWFVKLFPAYLGDPLALTCPEDPYRYRLVKARDAWDNPSIVDYSSYGMNSFIMDAAGGKLANLDRHRPTRPLDTILVGDLGPDYGSKLQKSRSSKQKGPRRNRGMLSWDDGYDPMAIQPRSSAPWLTLRHGPGINMLTITGGVRTARTAEVMHRPISRYYPDCAAGGCTLCNADLEYSLFHYSFAQDHLYWWTGPVVAE